MAIPFEKREATVGRVQYFLDFNCFLNGYYTNRPGVISRELVKKLCVAYNVEEPTDSYNAAYWTPIFRYKLAVAMSRTHDTMGEVAAAIHLLRE